MKMKRTAVWVMSCAGLTMFGCSHHDRSEDSQAARPQRVRAEKQHGEDFPEEDQVQTVDRFTLSQAAAGARTDGMLFPGHFNGNELNALGQAKLNLMLQGKGAQDGLTIWMDMPKDAVEDRRGTVERYVHAMGIPGEKVQVRNGPNPMAMIPAAMGLASIKKTESGHKGSSSGTGESIEVGATGAMVTPPSK